MAWTDDINDLVHQHVKPYNKAAQLAHAVQAIALDIVNRQTGQLNRLDEVIDELTVRAEAAEAERDDALASRDCAVEVDRANEERYSIMEAERDSLRAALSKIAGPNGGYDTWEARLALAALEGKTL